MNLVANKELFIKIASVITREGIDRLMSWLENESDFFAAPASTKHHLAVPGGLVRHSINVYSILKDKSKMYNDSHGLDISDETVAIVGLFHDICKANFYKISFRNVKNEKTGIWEKVPYIDIDDKWPLGHGEKSAFFISKYMKLTDLELFMIRYHMGPFESSEYGFMCSYRAALQKFPAVALAFTADFEASSVLESVEAIEVPF